MIRELLGYDKKKWNILRSCIRDNLAAARLDWSRRLRDQDKKKLAIAYHAVEQQFPETRRFENQWAVKRIAQQYWNQRKYHIRSERIASSSLDSLEGKDDFPARAIPRLDPIYKVPMSVIRTYIGYDKREWNSLRTCVRENLMAVSLDWSVPWRAQQPEKLVQAYDAVENRFPETRRFSQQWAVKAMAKVFWDACRRRGRYPFGIMYDKHSIDPAIRRRGRPPKKEQSI
ncbi:hypothetical protein FB446DRAFT_784828 [Lentinula raphanica]|nr:hypothetical protein FB446DRAFT_784828 [Lentinula raphanica]